MSLNISKIKNNLSVIILCGGEGQRLRPLTKKIPKPLIKIRNTGIIEYIINHFHRHKINNIIIATCYKDKLIKKFIKKKLNYLIIWKNSLLNLVLKIPHKNGLIYLFNEEIYIIVYYEAVYNDTFGLSIDNIP